MADRAVGTATSYPVDKQHVGVEDRELARGHWAGAPSSTRVRPSTIKYGDPSSAFYVDPNAPPPPAPSTSIGVATISGDTNANTGDTKTYTCGVSGDAGGLSYSWSQTGGTTQSMSDNQITILWDTETTGTVDCQVTSTDENVDDNPSDAATVSVDIVTLFSGLETEGGDDLTDESGNIILPE